MINTTKLRKLSEDFEKTLKPFESFLGNIYSHKEIGISYITRFIQYVEENDTITSKEIISKFKSLMYDLEYGNTQEAVNALNKATPIIELFKNKGN